jgi:hypothetical protein
MHRSDPIFGAFFPVPKMEKPETILSFPIFQALLNSQVRPVKMEDVKDVPGLHCRQKPLSLL